MDLLSTLAPSAQGLHALLIDESISQGVKRDSVTRAVLRASTSGDGDLLEWLLATSSTKQLVEFEAVDPDGSPALVLAACFGFGDAVRLLVEAGARTEAQDRSGWTALHWAAQNGDVPLASYLVNHRARTDIRSFKGLLPIDLAKRNQSGDDLRDILEAASDSQPLSSGQSFNSETSEASSTASSQRAEKKRKEKKAQKRSQLGRESALNLDVDPNLLGLPEQPWASTSAAPHSPSLAIASDHQPEFDFNHCQPSQMLVFGMEDLPLIFHRVITSMQPVRSLIQRVLPANVLFLCTRFAVHWSDSDLLDELLLGSIEAIEDVIQGGSDDLATCSFWLNNAVLLLYFLRIDRSTCDATKEYQLHWVELINELYVYVIRDIERRIDKILEPALLDFGELGEDVRFEGEWSFVKAFTSASNKSQRYVSASSTIAGSSTPTPTRTSIISLFGNAGDSAVSRTPSPSKKGNPSRPSSAQQTPNNNDHLPPETPSPKDISSLLTSALFILQLYETHPSIIVQAFSQILYWLSSELTNRILAHRKYLCRSKALQIRLNISTLEDWARLNGLPAKLVNSHFRPLGQLLQWLQCLSSEDTLDGLVGTIMNLKDLNPLQLRKVVKEYRHEVDEPHMSEECQQYLSQLERDWDRQRVSRSAQLAREDQLEDEESEDVAENGDHSIITKKVDDFGGDDSQTPGERRRIKRMEEHIDAVFDSPQKHHLFQPPPRAECFGELFDSRYMLPFALPSKAEHLLAIGQPHVFGPLSRPPTPKAGENTSNQPDLDSDLERKPFYDEQNRFVPVLPDGFLGDLDKLRTQQGQHKHTPLREHALRRSLTGDDNKSPEAAGLGIDDASDPATLNLLRWDNWRDKLAAEMKQLELEEPSQSGST